MSEHPSVLIAGGAGYIGSHTTKLFLREGFHPVVLDNLCTGNRWALRYGDFYEGSIADEALVKRIVAEKKIQAVVLFAGHINVGESAVNPRIYFRNNVADAIYFLEALLDAGVQRLVFSSSCAIYGIQEKVPIAEDASRNPMSAYAETKQMLEEVLARYDAAHGLRSVCLRYFNAAGADLDGELGEAHDPETHLIPLAIEAALGGKPLNVFGTDYPTPDGTAIRDYIHVMDLADAHVRAARHLLNGGGSLQLNLGTGNGFSVREVIQTVEKVGGRPVPAQYGPRRPGDPPALVADARLTRASLGWVPAVSSLETIVSSAWRWHSEVLPGLRKG